MKFKYIYYAAAVAVVFFSGFYIGGERSRKLEETVPDFSGDSAAQKKSQKNSAGEERIAAAEDSKNTKDTAVRHSGNKEEYLSPARGDGRHDKETKPPAPLIDNLLSSMQEHGLPKEDAARIAAVMKAAEEANRQEQLPQKETADAAASSAMNEADLIANFREAGVPEKAIGPMALAVSSILKGRDAAVSKEELTYNFRDAGVRQEDASQMADVMQFKPEKDAEIVANIEKMKSQIAAGLRKAGAANEGSIIPSSK